MRIILVHFQNMNALERYVSYSFLLSSSSPLSISFFLSNSHTYSKKNLGRNYRISILFFNLMGRVFYICHRHFISGDKSWDFHLSFWVCTLHFLLYRNCGRFVYFIFFYDNHNRTVCVMKINFIRNHKQDLKVYRPIWSHLKKKRKENRTQLTRSSRFTVANDGDLFKVQRNMLHQE